MECTEFHTVLDRRISGYDSDREVFGDVLDPSALANEPERNGFIEAFGSDFGRVLDSLGISRIVRGTNEPAIQPLLQTSRCDSGPRGRESWFRAAIAILWKDPRSPVSGVPSCW
jgi:hypothetical protein